MQEASLCSGNGRKISYSIGYFYFFVAFLIEMHSYIDIFSLTETYGFMLSKFVNQTLNDGR